jgi:UPF0716 family protein affecting phage T7 exclusion
MEDKKKKVKGLIRKFTFPLFLVGGLLTTAILIKIFMPPSGNNPTLKSHKLTKQENNTKGKNNEKTNNTKEKTAERKNKSENTAQNNSNNSTTNLSLRLEKSKGNTQSYAKENKKEEKEPDISLKKLSGNENENKKGGIDKIKAIEEKYLNPQKNNPQSEVGYKLSTEPYRQKTYFQKIKSNPKGLKVLWDKNTIIVNGRVIKGEPVR